MTLVDWIFIVIVAFFSVRSLLRGATREIFSLLALVLAFLCSFRYAALLEPLLQPYISLAWGRTLAAFAIVFLAVYILINVTGSLLSALLKKISLSSLDKTAGAFVGAAKAYIIISCLIIAVLFVPRGQSVLQKSIICEYCLPCITFLVELLPAKLKHAVREKTRALDRSAPAAPQSQKT